MKTIQIPLTLLVYESTPVAERFHYHSSSLWTVTLWVRASRERNGRDSFMRSV